MTPLHDMIGRRVRIIAGDIVYKGILIEVSEENAALQTESQWITIPIDNINSILIEEG
ncbi:MAG TPA: hypothetical protein VJ187_04485 [Nitrospirota bacterium]|nr:hypothetical protein [Nitrospirota bacterium]